MEIRKTACAALIGAFGWSGLLRAEGTVEEVLAADRAFAAQASETGAQSAFLEALGADAILFRPLAVNGREWLQTHEQASGRLEWSPAAAAISCDGQLALTLGPWTYRQQSATASGHYLTVWRRDAAGDWAVVLDHGIEDASGVAGMASIASLLAANWPQGAARQCGRGGDSSGVAQADRAVNEAIRGQGLDAALRGLAGPRTLLLRDGHAPAGAAPDWPRDESILGAPLDATTGGTFAAPGSDLGYSYGEIAARAGAPSPTAVRAVYVRIWVREGAAWRVAVDMLTPLPTPAAGAPSQGPGGQ